MIEWPIYMNAKAIQGLLGLRDVNSAWKRRYRSGADSPIIEQFKAAGVTAENKVEIVKVSVLSRHNKGQKYNNALNF